MGIYTLSRLSSTVYQCTKSQGRPFFYWLTIVFNRVNDDHRRELGPDISCAEWLLRNGAYVKWKDSIKEVRDYNALPTTHSNYFIEDVNAINAGISDIGFPHFEGCKHIKKVRLESCKYINDTAISMLSILKDSLTDVLILDCKNITDDGLRKLKKLKNLEHLNIRSLPYVKNMDAVCAEIKEALPNLNGLYFKST
ncbi:ATP synthase subunit s, mitochondrial-like isoform X3 [Lasioglossum baleicum]|uniref:ATP synthase subunit s, mitochondrial-like isoform X3 n=1 Tax=Lasioglossum baleicum TaxID=434251 RepID=UPI003FCCDE94